MILANSEAKWLKSRFLKELQRLIFAQKVSNDGTTTFFINFYQYNRFLGYGELLKLWLLIRYDALWIHNIDVICSMKKSVVNFSFKKLCSLHVLYQ